MAEKTEGASALTTEIGRKIDLRMSRPGECCDDGYCFEGLGIHEVGYGEARSIELAIFAARERAWDEGYGAGWNDRTRRGQTPCAIARTPNPYRPTSPEEATRG